MRAPVRVGVRLLVAGTCRHAECMVTGRFGLKVDRFPVLVGVISHPTRGTVLFDTGFGDALATSRDPVARLYRRFMPYNLGPQEACVHQLAALGLAEVHAIVLSHLHPDHAGGLADFPGVPVYLSRATFDTAAIQAFRRRIKLGLVRDLIPADLSSRAALIERAVPLNGAWRQFEGSDIFGDGSLTAIPLPGHADGQIGLKLTHESGREVFFAADAAWQARCYREMLEPLAPARRFIADYPAYRATLAALRDLWRADPDVAIVPSHCADSIEVFRDEFG